MSQKTFNWLWTACMLPASILYSIGFALLDSGYLLKGCLLMIPFTLMLLAMAWVSEK